MVALRSQGNWRWEGPLGTPLGLVHWKRDRKSTRLNSRGTLRFLPQLEMRPSSNAPNPVESREAPPTSSFPDFSEPP